MSKFELSKPIIKPIIEIIAHNHFHNILRLFDVLTNFPFNTNETMRDYYL